jgi:4-amino-4-deoxy-L-arabinose transferase-like glycosyltransferase
VAYALFGLCAGLGVLSKYNFALVVVALALAAISVREFRAVILDKRIVLAGLVAVLVVLPNLWWAKTHPELALRAAGKFKIQESSHWFSAIASGFKTLVVGSVTFFGPLALLYGIIFWKRPAAGATTSRNPYVVLLVRVLIISYGIIVLAIVVLRISEVRDRWLQPILICSPLLAIAWLQERLNAARLKWILALATVAAILVTEALHGRIIWAERMHRTQPWNRPYDALAAQLRNRVAPASVIMTDTTLLAGNLRLNIPDKIFTTPELAGLFSQTNSEVALVWDAGEPGANKSGRKQSREWPPPDNLADFAEKAGIKLDPAQAQYFDALFKYHKTRRMKVGVLVK